MRFLSTILICFFSIINISSQGAEIVVTRNGSELPDLRYRASGTVWQDDGTFLLLTNQTNPDGPFNQVIIDRINTEGEILVSDTLNTEVSQFGFGLLGTDDGFTWIQIQVIRNDFDNYSDLRLIKYGAEGVAEEYFYDEYRYERGTEGMVQSSPNTISLITLNRDGHLDDNQARVMTINSDDGEIVSEVELSDFDDQYDYATLTKGEDGEVLAAFSNRRISTSSSTAATLDVIEGTLDADDLNFMLSDCELGENTPYAMNYLYDEANEVYLAVNECLEVYEISQDGMISVKENAESVAIGPQEAIYLRSADEGLYVYADRDRYLLSTDGQMVEVVDQVSIPYDAFRIGSDFNNGLLISGGRNSFLTSVWIRPELAPEFSIVSAYEDLIGRTTRHIGRSIGLNNDEIVVCEEINLGRDGNILFYSPTGEIIDSLTFDDELEIDARGIGVLPDENYFTGILNRNNNVEQIDVVSFNRQEGIIDTLRTIEEILILSGGLNYQARQSGDGNLYLSYLAFLDGEAVRRVVGVGPDGALNADVALLDVVSGIPNKPVADQAGNLYLTKNPDMSSTFELQKYNANSSLVYSIDVEHEYALAISFSSAVINETENRLLIAGGGIKEGGVVENFFYEFDTQNGELLRFEVVNMDQGVGATTQAIYQPATNNILVFFIDFKGDEQNVNDRYSITFSIYDDTDLTYTEDIITSIDQYRLYDIALNDNDEAFLTGYVQNTQDGSLESIFIGVDYDEVVSVEEVEDLAEVANLSVFPNPTEDRTTVNWDNPKAGAYALELMSHDGKHIARWQGAVPPSRASVEVDLSRLPGGTYLLRLTTDDGVSTQRVIKQ